MAYFSVYSVVDWKVYGLGTDEHIKKYCSDREIPCADIEQRMRDKKIPLEKDWHPEMVVLKTKDLCGIIDSALTELSIDSTKLNLFLTGSGVYHHVTYGLLNGFGQTEFDVVNIDEHCDRSEFIDDDLICCASHIHEAFKNGIINNYFHIAQSVNEQNMITRCKPDSYTAIYHTIKEGRRFPTTEITAKELKTELIGKYYLTIDIDVLSTKYVTIDRKWYGSAQGNMSIGTLLKIVRELPLQNALGADICGMCKDKRSEHIYDSLLQLIRN